MRTARVTTICLAALSAMAIAPALASATPGSIADTNLATGTWDEPYIHEYQGDVWSSSIQWDNQGFDGGVLPGNWTTAPWTTGGEVSPSGNMLAIDGARVYTNATFDAPKALYFDGTFSGDPFQHMGLGTDFNAPPWAMFSTGATGDALYARTQVTGGQPTDVKLAVDPLAYHEYEIRWTANQVVFFVDGALVSTQDVAVPDGLHFIASDANLNGTKLLLDGIKILSYYPQGTFTSQVLDSSPDVVGTWSTLTAEGKLDGVSFRTRTGDTETPDASWSAWQSLGNGGKIQSPAHRYLQYEATLSSLGGVYEDRLNAVTVGYDTDSTAPTTVLGGVSVSGTTATASFSARTRTSTASSASSTRVRTSRARARRPTPASPRAPIRSRCARSTTPPTPEPPCRGRSRSPHSPVVARPVAARPVAARPVAARPVAARPVAARPAAAPRSTPWPRSSCSPRAPCGRRGRAGSPSGSSARRASSAAASRCS